MVGFLGQVYTWRGNNQALSWTPQLIDSLKAYRAVHVRFKVCLFYFARKLLIAV